MRDTKKPRVERLPEWAQKHIGALEVNISRPRLPLHRQGERLMGLLRHPIPFRRGLPGESKYTRPHDSGDVSRARQGVSRVARQDAGQLPTTVWGYPSHATSGAGGGNAMTPPPIGPRDVLALERLVEGAAADPSSPQARAYEAVLTALKNVILERNRFEARASMERWRRIRVQRCLAHARAACGILLAAVAVLLLTLVVRGAQ